MNIVRMSTPGRSYNDAVAALNTLQTNFSILDAIRKSGGKKNLNAIPQMLEWARRAGYPDPKEFDQLNIIHVTGTKGKGSTCAFVQSILSRYQNKVGLYTSPHLKSVRERICINGQPISKQKFAKYFFELWDRLESSESDLTTFPDMGPGIKPVYFRFLTLLSFHVFLNEGVDAAIYEVGIGGEYDSTNIIVKPTATGITSLGIDHVNVLGSTLEEIAWHKSGIFKAGVPAIALVQSKESVTDVIKKRAEEKHVASLTFLSPTNEVSSLQLGLSGSFQKYNASVAVELCRNHLQQLDLLSIDSMPDHTSKLPDLFVQGLESASWPGRCQTLPDKDDSHITYYLDGAHTQESIEVAANWFNSIASQQNGVRILLFNQQTRDANALLGHLYKTIEYKFDHVIFTSNMTWARGQYSADLASFNTNSQDVIDLVVQKALAQAWKGLDQEAGEPLVLPTIEDSVNKIRDLAATVPATTPVQVFVTGSLHLVGGFLAVVDNVDDEE